MKKEIKKQLESKKKSRRKLNWQWTIQLTLVAAIISVFLTFVSQVAMQDVHILIGVMVILTFIGIGILFDMIGVAVTSADEAPFHAMSSKKVIGAKTAVKLKKSADKVSSFCCDVIGDICGIISGAAGVVVATQLADIFKIPALVSSLIITGFISALTIGGKSLEKSTAINNGNKILYNFAKVLNVFNKE